VHSLTFSPGIAKGFLLLSDCDNAYGQVWHLPPTAPNLPTGKKSMQITAKEVWCLISLWGYETKWLIRLSGLSEKIVAELYKMS
jgi:hypothetical protein